MSVVFIDTKPEQYNYYTSDEKIIDSFRSLPERTKKLDSQETARFTQIFDQLVNTKSEGNPYTPGDSHLNDSEREEFASLIKTMGVQHMIYWSESSYVCCPPHITYILYNFPVNPVEAVLRAVNHHKSRLASNGMTSITIGNVKSSDIKKIGVYVEVDTRKEMKHGYFPSDTGPCGTGVPLQRVPDDLDGFTIVESPDELSDIGLIDIID
ncbi:MAG: hypothetical protein CMO81_09095 [Waddliaceae bacterium]|nr:hypothetical protein [Waddliaceae bacterium]